MARTTVLGFDDAAQVAQQWIGHPAQLPSVASHLQPFRVDGITGPSMKSMSDEDAGERPELPVAVPTIPASAGALVRGRKGRLLILKPTYKGGWTVPGGVIEIGESPWEACRRETKEECGLNVTGGRLVCVDFLRPRPGRPGGMRSFRLWCLRRRSLGHSGHPASGDRREPGPAARDSAASPQRAGPTSGPRRLRVQTGALSRGRPPGRRDQVLEHRGFIGVMIIWTVAGCGPDPSWGEYHRTRRRTRP